METVKKLMRTNSTGVPASIARARHHAPAILPMISGLKGMLDKVGFALWKQGDTVHEFETEDGVRYTLRGFSRDGEYVGVRLALRVSRSLEYRLIDIEDVKDVPRLLDTMRMLAVPNTGNDTGVMVSNA
jgi:hypothetical protein